MPTLKIVKKHDRVHIVWLPWMVLLYIWPSFITSLYCYTVIATCYHYYCAAGFVCKVLICVNSTTFCGVTDLIPQLRLCISLFQLSHCCTCHNPMSCNLIVQCLFTSTYFKRVDISILLCCSIWSERLFNTCFIAIVQNFSMYVNSTKHPCKCGIFWSYSLLYRILL